MNGNCKVCGRTREDHCKDKDGVWWCCDNVSVRASFKIESESDRKIDSINRIAQFEEDAGLYDKVLLSSQRKKYNIPTGMLEAAVSAIPEDGRIFLSGCPGWPGMNACLEAAMCWIDDELEKMELCSIDYKNLHQKFFTLKGREK
jgi:hypothetical protein